MHLLISGRAELRGPHACPFQKTVHIPPEPVGQHQGKRGKPYNPVTLYLPHACRCEAIIPERIHVYRGRFPQNALLTEGLIQVPEDTLHAVVDAADRLRHGHQVGITLRLVLVPSETVQLLTEPGALPVKEILSALVELPVCVP